MKQSHIHHQFRKQDFLLICFIYIIMFCLDRSFLLKITRRPLIIRTFINLFPNEEKMFSKRHSKTFSISQRYVKNGKKDQFWASSRKTWILILISAFTVQVILEKLLNMANSVSQLNNKTTYENSCSAFLIGYYEEEIMEQVMKQFEKL